MEIIGFGVLVLLICWALWALFRQVGRAMIEGEMAVDRHEREHDIEAIQDDLYACSMPTPNGVRYLGPSGRLYTKDDIFPVIDHQTERAEGRR